MPIQQYGARLVGSKKTLFFISQDPNITALKQRLINHHLLEVELVGHQGKTVVIGANHVVMLCGPNDPSKMEELFDGN